MKVIAITNQKGGCGKSTIALNLAINLSLKGKGVVLFDTDPQQNALGTIQSRTDDLIPAYSVKSDIHKKIQSFDHLDYGIIDTPPHQSEIIRSALVSADLVIIPIQDSPLDIRSSKETVALVYKAKAYRPGMQVYFLLNRIQPNTILARGLRKHLERVYPEVGILKTELHNRVVYKQSLIYGQAVTEFEKRGPATEEINALTREIIDILE